MVQMNRRYSAVYMATFCDVAVFRVQVAQCDEWAHFCAACYDVGVLVIRRDGWHKAETQGVVGTLKTMSILYFRTHVQILKSKNLTPVRASL